MNSPNGGSQSETTSERYEGINSQTCASVKTDRHARVLAAERRQKATRPGWQLAIIHHMRITRAPRMYHACGHHDVSAACHLQLCRLPPLYLHQLSKPSSLSPKSPNSINQSSLPSNPISKPSHQRHTTKYYKHQHQPPPCSAPQSSAPPANSLRYLTFANPPLTPSRRYKISVLLDLCSPNLTSHASH